MTATRVEQDSLGPVNVPADRLWGAQTQRSLEHFSIGDDLIPREMIPAYAIVKKAAALVNNRAGRLGDAQKDLIVSVCDEILQGQHDDQFPLHVWMTGSGTQFNMNVNEVIANRCSQIAGQPLGSHQPVHPNDHVNMSQSSNDSFPTAMNVAAALGVKQRLMPALERPARCPRRQGQGLGGHCEDRAHPPPGRNASDTRPGILWVRRHARRRSGTVGDWRCAAFIDWR